MNRDEQIREVKSATLLRFNQIWQRNFLSNRNAIERNPGVIGLKNKFRDIPCIVVGAGPSLDKNIKYLKRPAKKPSSYAAMQHLSLYCRTILFLIS